MPRDPDLVRGVHRSAHRVGALAGLRRVHDCVAIGAAARHDVREPLRIADVRHRRRSAPRTAQRRGGESVEVVGAHDLRGALGAPGVRDALGRRERQPDGVALGADPAEHLASRPVGANATPRRRELGMQLVGQWSHRDAELFEERRAVAPEVAPRAQVVAPDDRLHLRGERYGAAGKVDSCASRPGT